MPVPPLRPDLLVKWREQSQLAQRDAEIARRADDGAEGMYHDGRAITYERCADELDAALSAAGVSSPPLDLILDSVQARRKGKINETECLDEIERVALCAELIAEIDRLRSSRTPTLLLQDGCDQTPAVIDGRGLSGIQRSSRTPPAADLLAFLDMLIEQCRDYGPRLLRTDWAAESLEWAEKLERIKNTLVEPRTPPAAPVEREPVGWWCACGHPNGINLATCACCNRAPGGDNPVTTIYRTPPADKEDQ